MPVVRKSITCTARTCGEIKGDRRSRSDRFVGCGSAELEAAVFFSDHPFSFSRRRFLVVLPFPKAGLGMAVKALFAVCSVAGMQSAGMPRQRLV